MGYFVIRDVRFSQNSYIKIDLFSYTTSVRISILLYEPRCEKTGLRGV